LTLSCKGSLDLDLDADAPSLLIPSRMSSKEDVLDLPREHEPPSVSSSACFPGYAFTQLERNSPTW